MKQISESELTRRIQIENPWWVEGAVSAQIRNWERRSYFCGFIKLIQEVSVRRAVILMGPRRVGKTVMIKQAIQHLLDQGIPSKSILYVSVNTPIFTGLWLEKFLNLFQDMHGHDRRSRLYVFFDEIQYLPDWERHLKSLVDSYLDVRFIASGSAAAALKLKSRESGAGRFTDFVLPPLSFKEFLMFMKLERKLIPGPGKAGWKIEELNAAFVDYLNFGGFPELVMIPAAREGARRYIADDIIDRVLLGDLPSLYGIRDVQELKRLFAMLAYNTGQEINIDELSKSSQVAKNTVKKYLEYLEAAFLICRIYRVDQGGVRFKKISNFKVYLTNPCIRAAFFGPVEQNDSAMGGLVETAIVAQWTQTTGVSDIYYARWKKGRVTREVDLVRTELATQNILWAMEIKWSDRAYEQPERELRGLLEFSVKAKVKSGPLVTTKTKTGDREVEGTRIAFRPASVVCYWIGMFVESSIRKGVHPVSGKSFIEKLMEKQPI